MDKHQLQNMENSEKREKRVAVDVKGISKLDVLVHVLLHRWCLEVSIREEPKAEMEGALWIVSKRKVYGELQRGKREGCVGGMRSGDQRQDDLSERLIGVLSRGRKRKGSGIKLQRAKRLGNTHCPPHQSRVAIIRPMAMQSMQIIHSSNLTKAPKLSPKTRAQPTEDTASRSTCGEWEKFKVCERGERRERKRGEKGEGRRERVRRDREKRQTNRQTDRDDGEKR